MSYTPKEKQKYLSKLTIDDVKQIKLLLSQGLEQHKISKIFNVSKITISRISTGKIWKKVIIEE